MKKFKKTLFVLIALITALFAFQACEAVPVTPATEATITPTATEKDPLTEMVIKADLIVLGTISDFRYEVVDVIQPGAPGKLAYTIFTLAVEKVIKGDTNTKQVFIKVAGGKIGDVTQQPTGLYFAKSDRILVSLHKLDDNYYTAYATNVPDVLWIAGGIYNPKRSLEDTIGRVINIMKANNIPIALPPDEWPPLPAGPVSRPK